MTTENKKPFAFEAEAAMRQGPTWGGEALEVAREEGASDIARCINDLIDGDETP